ncbi:LysR family transcriptional regulator [Trinickia mobilis]|uniref:LysR family transcriptional regulator n=1 Tax=Trinickia mobilis TaxID=2816356 RepID=UPI001A900AC0|nr:LysR family transcriptional regulator [Trinickia mobilis]
MDRLTAMEIFINVVEAGSFSAAARRMDLGQPAISRSIAQTEERLGARLLLRSARGLTMTDAGQRFYEHAKLAVKEADEADEAVHDASQSLAGRLRVSAPVTFACLYVLPSLDSFLSHHPKLEVDVTLDDRDIDLLEEGVDVALRIGSLADSAMTARRIGQSPRHVVGTTEYFARAGIPETPADLSHHQAIVYLQQLGGEAWSFSRNGTNVAVTLSGRVRISAAEGIRTAVLGGMGFAVAARWLFSRELASGKVEAVLTDWTLPPVDLWAVFPSGRMVTAKTRAFVAFVEQALAEAESAATGPPAS